LITDLNKPLLSGLSDETGKSLEMNFAKFFRCRQNLSRVLPSTDAAKKPLMEKIPNIFFEKFLGLWSCRFSICKKFFLQSENRRIRRGIRYAENGDF
jgi:hypothetical protein